MLQLVIWAQLHSHKSDHWKLYLLFQALDFSLPPHLYLRLTRRPCFLHSPTLFLCPSVLPKTHAAALMPNAWQSPLHSFRSALSQRKLQKSKYLKHFYYTFIVEETSDFILYLFQGPNSTFFLSKPFISLMLFLNEYYNEGMFQICVAKRKIKL